MHANLQSLLGLLVLTILAAAFAGRGLRTHWRQQIRIAAIGLAVQLVMAVILLKLLPSELAFGWLNRAVEALQRATEAGSGFVFGYLGGGPLPFEETRVGASFVLAFRALPMVLVVSALSALLFYWRVLPRVVAAFAWLLERSLGVGGAVGVSAAANVFVGMVEAPLLVRPYLAKLSRSELFTVMTCGMATIAGTVFVLYATFLRDAIPGAAGHLLTASLLSAPAAITVARLMMPEPAERRTEGGLDVASESDSAMDAITRGTLDGAALLINIIAMLLVLVALVHLANQILGLLPDLAGAPLTLERMLGWLFAPIAWLLGLPWSEAVTGGQLLGIKTVLNELLAYLQLAGLPADALAPRSRLILTYAICGFANLGSLGIMIGGLATLVPERRSEVAALGGLSIVAGTLATCMTGAMVGLLVAP